MERKQGEQSIQFDQAPFIVSHASVVGKKEGEGPLGNAFDLVNPDDLFGKSTWEEAESAMQKEACLLALQKGKTEPEEVRFLFGGDLLRQGIATSMGVEPFRIPLFGLYGACSTSGEALALGAMTVAGGYADYTLAVTSSHFGSAEKEFRFPLGYANQRPLSAQWTVTGSGAFLLGRGGSSEGDSGIESVLGSGKEKSHVRIRGVTIGKIVDYGLKDSQNMGACMAPAAADTIHRALTDFQMTPDSFDKIITGDLGYIGSEILLDILEKNEIVLQKKHLDCGKLIFDQETQDTHAGGSGCGCAATTLSAYILPRLWKGEWKRVLFVPTGALMSTVSFNEGKSVPGIAHAILLEHC